MFAKNKRREKESLHLKLSCYLYTEFYPSIHIPHFCHGIAVFCSSLCINCLQGGGRCAEGSSLVFMDSTINILLCQEDTHLVHRALKCLTVCRYKQKLDSLQESRNNSKKKSCFWKKLLPLSCCCFSSTNQIQDFLITAICCQKCLIVF